MSDKKNNHLLNLTESVGEFIQYWGFKSIHGKIWCLIFLRKDPMSSREIQNELGISKALLSMSINELLKYKVIIEDAKTSYGRQTYRASLKVTEVIWGVLENRELKLIQNVMGNIENLKALSSDEKKALNVDSKRLKKMSDLVSTASKTLSAILKWKSFNFSDWLTSNFEEK